MGEQLPVANASIKSNGHREDDGYVLRNATDLNAVIAGLELNPPLAPRPIRDWEAVERFAQMVERIPTPDEAPQPEDSRSYVTGYLTDHDGTERSVTFTFSRFVVRGRYTDADLAVDIGGERVYQVRTSVDAHVEQERLARTLERSYPAPGPGWARMVNGVCGKAREDYLSAAIAVPLDSVTVSFDDLYLVEGIVPLSGVTILYGQGGFGKGWLAHSLANAIGAGAPFLDRETKQSPVLYLDYEDTQMIARRRNVRLTVSGSTPQQPEGSFYWMPGRGIAVVEQLETIRRELRRTGAGVLIVDSALPALGGNASDAEAVSRLMYHGLDTLNVPVILIAHVNRADDDRYPFGSIYWHNAARMTWNIKRVDSEETGDIKVLLTHKKANNGRKQPQIGIAICFDDPHGPVDLSLCDVEEIREQMVQEQGPTMPEQIWDLLAGGPMTPSEIGKALPQMPEANTVRNKLGRMLENRRFAGLQRGGKKGKEQLWQRTIGRTIGAEQGVLEDC